MKRTPPQPHISHLCASYLEEARRLLVQELEALEAGNDEQLEALAEARQQAVKSAFAAREGFDAGILRQQLEFFYKEQERLIELATEQLQDCREKLSVTRQQSQYFSGYRHRTAQARRSFYCDTQS